MTANPGGIVSSKNVLGCVRLIERLWEIWLFLALDAELIATDLSIETETFDGPIRYVRR